MKKYFTLFFLSKLLEHGVTLITLTSGNGNFDENDEMHHLALLVNKKKYLINDHEKLKQLKTEVEQFINEFNEELTKLNEQYFNNLRDLTEQPMKFIASMMRLNIRSLEELDERARELLNELNKQTGNALAEATMHYNKLIQLNNNAANIFANMELLLQKCELLLSSLNDLDAKEIFVIGEDNELVIKPAFRGSSDDRLNASKISTRDNIKSYFKQKIEIMEENIQDLENTIMTLKKQVSTLMRIKKEFKKELKFTKELAESAMDSIMAILQDMFQGE